MNRRRHIVAADFKLNPELKDAVSTLRGSMTGAAERYPLDAKVFEVTYDEAKPLVHIKHLATGRTACVGLFAYKAVREVLNTLFC